MHVVSFQWVFSSYCKAEDIYCENAMHYKLDVSFIFGYKQNAHLDTDKVNFFMISFSFTIITNIASRFPLLSYAL